MASAAPKPERLPPDFYMLAPAWDRVRCPESHHKAKPTDWAYVANEWVIEVTDAAYRLSSQSGLFLLASQAISRRNRFGEPRVGVYCLWFGHKLKTHGPIALRLVESQYRTIESFTGWVITNLSL
ncbi:MAG: hypothetical protein EBZ03_09910 [Betaproteobacteria bacterium]|nr:hypothetical protein [Betaproteobacteria bacterium]NBO45301.1 hypothetical protein [Betaproteobacteria bacterium]NBP11586.1 hypothetical protein [Betaproteobacteria bacterium]NBP61951.1 hypothetical protein [Betaproteobacteria bacterium]NBQ82506.1 hypothetical protein [Betaproteobacteria bacterium]